MIVQINNLDAFLGGAFSERVKEALGKISANIMDPNTLASRARTLTIKISIVPAKNRRNAEITVDVGTALAGYAPIETSGMIAVDEETGELIIVEDNGELPGQTNLDGEEAQPNVLRMGGKDNA
ncbi:MAG: hypothetical protein LBD02_01320 [Christensenellaceae bacterium]|nr:hypothetical protein [Christensenellaceae bacterium]